LTQPVADLSSQYARLDGEEEHAAHHLSLMPDSHPRQPILDVPRHPLAKERFTLFEVRDLGSPTKPPTQVSAILFHKLEELLRMARFQNSQFGVITKIMLEQILDPPEF
jgi:hypothetical protein